MSVTFSGTRKVPVTSVAIMVLPFGSALSRGAARKA